MKMPICKTCHGEYTLETCLCPNCGRPLRRGEDFCQHCRTVVSEKRLCPRCKSDVTIWEREDFSLVEFIKRWGALGLLPSLGAVLAFPLLWLPNATTLHYLMTAFSIGLSQLIIILLYIQRLLWREHNWATQIYDAKFYSLPSLIGMMFFAGSVLSAVVIVIQQRWDAPSTLDKLFFAVSYVGMMGVFTAGFTLLAIQDYLNQLEERVPQPIFADMEKLLHVVLDAAIRTLNLLDGTEIQSHTDAGRITDRTYEVLEASRVPENGGIVILLHEYKPAAEPDTQGKWAHETWHIEADRWGRIQTLQPARVSHRG
ncbi:MAG: hypothetical protein GVY30_00555 [Chloroflexi bacterium]|nr:hypothetical protein [Chloroflexota bacterium]